MSLKKSGCEPHIAAALAKSYEYSGNETCATDGLCALNCPVKIDTGKLIKNIRSEGIVSQRHNGLWVADHMNLITSVGRRALSIVDFFHTILGTRIMQAVSGGLRRISGYRMPAWNQFMPKGARVIKTQNEEDPNNLRKVVYFPSCINRTMGISKDHNDEVQLSDKMIQLLHKGGYEIIYPENLNNLCCGMAFSSKGYTKASEKKSNELEAALLKASKNGKYPVLCDMSPCLYTMKESMKSGLNLYEPVGFITDRLLSYLTITPLDEVITVFPVCSMKKMDLNNKLTDLARICAKEVIIPDTNCCGFAGDRGFSFPELNAHGLRELKTQIPDTVKHGFSTSRTCEIGLSLHSEISYKSIVYLVDKVSTPIK
jgi:D-lactate dehydrogenase